MVTSKVEVYQSQRVVWRIENFSKLNTQKLHSDTFSLNGRKWRILLINPKSIQRFQTHSEIFLCPVCHTEFDYDYTLSVIDQKDDSRTMKTEVIHEFNTSPRAYHPGHFLRLSKLHNPDNGYLLNDTFIVEVEISKSKSKVEDYFDYLDSLCFVDSMFFFTLGCFLASYLTCVALVSIWYYNVPLVSIWYYKVPYYIDMMWITCFAATLVFSILKFLPNNSHPRGETNISAPLPAKVIQLVSNVDPIKVSKEALEKKNETGCKNHKTFGEKTQMKEQLKVSEIEPAGSNLVDSPEVGLVNHPGARQIFEGGIHNNQSGILDGEVYEEIGGFSVKKSHASLYKEIWLKYGHIASNHVLTASSYLIQVMAVSDIMDSLVEMSCCRFVEASSEMIGLWEGRIKTAENLQFNIEWLRQHFDSVKQGFIEMQKLKTTLQEEVQPIKAAKERVTAAEDELKKVQAQLTMAKDELKEKIYASAIRVSPLTISESEFEMYLEKGDTFLFDGVF